MEQTQQVIRSFPPAFLTSAATIPRSNFVYQTTCSFHQIPWSTLNKKRLSISPVFDATHRKISRCTLAPEHSTISTNTSTNTSTSTTSKPLLHQVISHPVPGFPEWRYTGPDLEEGPLPSIIYFALTAHQSLELDPFNQYVQHIENQIHDNLSMRIFSVTLPLHVEQVTENEQVFNRWAQIYKSGGDLLSPFLRHIDNTLLHFISLRFISSNNIHVAGLSRGGLIAGLIMSRNHTLISSCVMFAPVTQLSALKELNQLIQNDHDHDNIDRIKRKIQQASLIHNQNVLNNLIRKPVRIYMGNYDTRVGTKQAFDFVHQLAQTAAQNGVRSPPHEFIMYCSVGKHGHGTPPDVFEAGARFTLSQIDQALVERKHQVTMDRSNVVSHTDR